MKRTKNKIGVDGVERSTTAKTCRNGMGSVRHDASRHTIELTRPMLLTQYRGRLELIARVTQSLRANASGLCYLEKKIMPVIGRSGNAASKIALLRAGQSAKSLGRSPSN